MAGLENITTGPAKMYYVHFQGYGEVIKFRCSGSGGTYANTLAKFLHQEKEKAEENDRRISFVIQWIAEDVDVNVGGTPDVVILLDNEPEFASLGSADTQKMGAMARHGKADLWKCIGPTSELSHVTTAGA